MYMRWNQLIILDRVALGEETFDDPVDTVEEGQQVSRSFIGELS